MVLSGRVERVLFVFPRGFDAVVHAGGTIARLVDAASNADVLTAERDDASENALWKLGARNVSVASDDAQRSVVTALDAQRSSAIVVPAAGIGGAGPLSELVAAAVAEASARHLPVYLAVSGRMPEGERLIAVDVSDQLGAKRDALAAVPGVLMQERSFSADGDAPRLLGPTEQFVMIGGGLAEREPAPSIVNRIGAAILGIAIGVIFAAMGTVAHQSTMTIAGVTIPWGLIVALIGLTALFIGLRLVLHDRLTVLATAIGALGTIFVLSLRSAGGSVLIPDGTLGLIWTMAPALIAAIVIAWPRLPVRPAARA